MYKNSQSMLTKNQQSNVNSVSQTSKNVANALNNSTVNVAQQAAIEQQALQKNPRHDDEPGSPNKKRSFRA